LGLRIASEPIGEEFCGKIFLFKAKEGLAD
jgi:hypothetical protein